LVVEKRGKFHVAPHLECVPERLFFCVWPLATNDILVELKHKKYEDMMNNTRLAISMKS